MPRAQHYAQNNAYRMVSGSSALDYPRYMEEEGRPPAYERRITMPPPEARVQQEQGIPSVVMIVVLSVILAILAGVSLDKRATSGALQNQIAEAEQELQNTRDTNLVLEQALRSSTDGEYIRNYAVNKLGMRKIQAENIHPVRMPDTRPMRDDTQESAQAKGEQGEGFMSLLADLLRRISL